jgi:hypothetical protein
MMFNVVVDLLYNQEWLKMLMMQLPMIVNLMRKDKDKEMLFKKLMKGSCEFPEASIDQVTFEMLMVFI